MKYIETHAHPAHRVFRDKEKYIKDIRVVGIKKLVVAPISYESNYLSMECFPEEKYPEVYFSKGLHPRCAMDSEFWEEDKINDFERLVQNHRVVAIKSGLDLSIKNLNIEQVQKQIKFLNVFIDFAYEHKKPLVLHVQDAAEELLELVKKKSLKTDTEVHCFMYNKSIMDRLINAGVNYFGLSGMITMSENDDLVEAVREMPLEMILIESDSPFLSYEGSTRIVGTSDKTLPVVVKKIAEIKQINENEVADVTYKNACKFFGLH